MAVSTGNQEFNPGTFLESENSGPLRFINHVPSDLIIEVRSRTTTCCACIIRSNSGSFLARSPVWALSVPCRQSSRRPRISPFSVEGSRLITSARTRINTYEVARASSAWSSGEYFRCSPPAVVSSLTESSPDCCVRHRMDDHSRGRESSTVFTVAAA